MILKLSCKNVIEIKQDKQDDLIQMFLVISIKILRIPI